MPEESGLARPVVTLFEQYGAGAQSIGQAVAARLGLPFHAQAFSSEDLEAADNRLAANAILASVLSTLGGAYGGFEGRDIVTTQEQKRDLVMHNNKVVWEEADQGGVIVGRNGAVILAQRPNTWNVLLTGDREDRIRRAAREQNLSEDMARRRQAKEDEVRVQMSQVLYGWNPAADRDRYDLVLDTSTISDQVAVSRILALTEEVSK